MVCRPFIQSAPSCNNYPLSDHVIVVGADCGGWSRPACFYLFSAIAVALTVTVAVDLAAQFSQLVLEGLVDCGLRGQLSLHGRNGLCQLVQRLGEA